MVEPPGGWRDGGGQGALRQPVHGPRGSHYWHTPRARGRSERFFATLQGRLPQELARAGITEMEEANDFLKGGFWLRFNESFAVSPKEAKS